jgi:translation elongation factor EF-4
MVKVFFVFKSTVAVLTELMTFYGNIGGVIHLCNHKRYANSALVGATQLPLVYLQHVWPIRAIVEEFFKSTRRVLKVKIHHV